jgi:NTP pyrophosphatase (non-canonical NTP hydrolase)
MDLNKLVLNYLAINDDDRPSSLTDCLANDGVSLDPEKYRQHQEKEDELGDAMMQLLMSYNVAKVVGNRKENKMGVVRSAKKRAKRRTKVLAPYYFDDEGRKVYLRPKQTYWYMMYVKSPPLADEKFNVKFRRRFRMPFGEYQRLLDKVKASVLFRRWTNASVNYFGNRVSPIELLLLGALRYLGRGLTFDDLEEYTAIHEETHRQFFHVFIEFGSTVLFEEFVKMPSTAV